MRTFIIAAALCLAGPVLASSMAEELTMDTVLGTTAQEVQAKLQEMGYDVRKIEMEDGKIEAYIVKDKAMGELYVDPASGKVLKLEQK